MARGRLPRDVLSRPRDTRRREAEITTVQAAADGELHGPELPALADGEAWHPVTVRLWDDLRRNPILRHEPALTWAYLVDTAALHHRFWAYGELKHAAEIRLRLAKVAATPEDRQRMKVKIAQHVPGSTPTPANVSDIATRRARLTDNRST
jgi:hypothetical protein